MNEKLDKKIRKHVKETYPFMSPTPVYETDANGVVRLAPVCQRAFIQNIKSNLRKPLHG